MIYSINFIFANEHNFMLIATRMFLLSRYLSVCNNFKGLNNKNIAPARKVQMLFSTLTKIADWAVTA
jgi:hypothetical protein